MNATVILADELFHCLAPPYDQIVRLTSDPIIIYNGEGKHWLRPEAALGISNAIFRQEVE